MWSITNRSPISIHRPWYRVCPQFHYRLDNPSNCYFNNFEEELFRDNALLTLVLGLLSTGLLGHLDLGIKHHTQAQYPIRHEGTNKTNLRLQQSLKIVCDVSSSSHILYRDRIYIIKDVILKLVEYGELNHTALVSFCGLNMTKHKPLIEDLETKQLITRSQILVGKRTITIYKPSSKGIEFCKSILEPYEIMFPRVVSGVR